MKHIALMVLLCHVSISLSASDVVDFEFFNDKQRGWFWKEPEPVIEEVKIKEEPAEEETSSKLTEISIDEQSRPEPYSSAWLRENLPLALDLARDNPTQENVSQYYYLQKVAMDKSMRFAHASRDVVLSDPILDMNTQRPLSSYGAKSVDIAVNMEIKKQAKEILKDTGVWYFYSSTCQYCAQQTPILKRLEKTIGLKVLPISLDGKPLQGGEYPEYVTDQGHSKMLNVTVTPTLYLAKKPDQYALLSHGITTDQEIIERIITASHQAGWIKDEEYQKTQRVRPVYIDETKINHSIPDLNKPDELVHILRSSIKNNRF